MKRCINLLIALMLLLAIVPVQPTAGFYCVDIVTNTNDAGPGSLRQLLAGVCDIGFDPSLSGATITLATTLTIGRNASIDAFGLASKVTISGNHNVRVIKVESGITATLNNLRIINGHTEDYPGGGGIHNSGTLTLRNTSVESNSAQYGAGILNNGGALIVANSTFTSNIASIGGGGVFNSNSGHLTVVDSMFSQNTAQRGGGIYNEQSPLTLTKSTLANNSAQGGYGGGIYNMMGSITVANSTFSGNSAVGWGSAIMNYGSLGLHNSTLSSNSNGIALLNTETGQLSFYNTVVANTVGALDCANINSGVIKANINNLVETTYFTPVETCWPPTGTQLSSDPLLGPLADNGGPTQTMALLAGSPAIDAGDDTICAAPPVDEVDQRGVTRPQDGDGDGVLVCDIGAYELRPDISPNTLPPATVGFPYSQQLTALGGTPSYTWTASGLPQQLGIIYDTGELKSFDHFQLIAGVIPFTATWNASTGVQFSKVYNLTVLPALTFSPTSIPTGKVNEDYYQVITLSGGTPPYTITNVSKPDWMSSAIDPAIGTVTLSGTPTVHGYFEVHLDVVDTVGARGAKTFKMWIGPDRTFTWNPDPAYQNEWTTFSPLSEFNNGITWWRGDTCETNIRTYGSTANVLFDKLGTEQICMKYWVVSINDFAWDKQMVTVVRKPPDISIDPEPSFPGQVVEVRAYFYSYGVGAFTCSIDWGDGSYGTGIFEPSGYCTFPPHSYTTIGSYTIQISVTDGEGATGTNTSTHEVVYLYPLDSATWLASNTLPTTITLIGMAPLGTTEMFFSVVNDPTHGTLGSPSTASCEALGYEDAVRCWTEVVFTPTITNPLYKGNDNFTFTVQDSAGRISQPGTINLVIKENNAPIAHDSTAVVLINEASSFIISATDMDADPHNYVFDEVSFHIDAPPQHGTLTFFEHPHSDSLYDGSWNLVGADWRQRLIYMPYPDTTASTDTFTFHVNDSHQDSNTATVTLNLRTPVTLHVNNNNDIVDAEGCTDTHCSLREAVNAAELGDTIDFTLSLPNTIVLTVDSGGELFVSENIHIVGPGANQLSVSAGFTDPLLPENPYDGFRVFHFYNNDEPMQASLSGLTIRDGRGYDGGGVYVNESASLIMNDCVIGPNNIVSVAGGGITLNEANLTMNNCSIIGNHGTGSEGGAGIYADDSNLTMINSTISGNVTNNYGGGILAYDDTVVTLIHSTITGNLANQDYDTNDWGGGGGIYNDGAEVTLWNTIVAGNTDLTNPTVHPKWPEIFGTITSLGGNLIGDGTGSTGWLASDLVGIVGDKFDPLLGILDVHVPGTTPTYPLLEGSPAINAVNCAPGVNIDQRGLIRPQGSACDIGAYELELNTTPYFTSTPLTTATEATSYSYAITSADQDPGDTLTITASIKPTWLTLTDNGDGTATLTGTPTNAHVGDNLVSLLVTDSQSATDTQEFTIKVYGPDIFSIFLPGIFR